MIQAYCCPCQNWRDLSLSEISELLQCVLISWMNWKWGRCSGTAVCMCEWRELMAGNSWSVAFSCPNQSGTLAPFVLKAKDNGFLGMEMNESQSHSLVWHMTGKNSVAAPGLAILGCFHLLPPVQPPAKLALFIQVPSGITGAWGAGPPREGGVCRHYRTIEPPGPKWQAPRNKAGGIYTKDLNPSQVPATYCALILCICVSVTLTV